MCNHKTDLMNIWVKKTTETLREMGVFQYMVWIATLALAVFGLTGGEPVRALAKYQSCRPPNEDARRATILM